MRIIVVGAGVVGASAAFHLTQSGAEVFLIDSNESGRATFAGAGIVCPWLSQSTDPRYQGIAFPAARYYPQLVDTLVAAGAAKVDYSLVGGLVVGGSVSQLNPVMLRLQGYLKRGIKEVGEVRLLNPGEPKVLFPYLDASLAGVHLTGAARVSGEDFRIALLNAALKSGAKALSGTAVLQHSNRTVTGVTVNGEPISAQTV
ncbi:MAG: FAD-binding oxidoreductase, partial [Verrucomicrobia bacterium]|nr:FAD-binding oxidoreductase [Verrucomicrobiota bacterium]